MMAWTGVPGSTLAEDDRIAPLFLIDVPDVSNRDSLIIGAIIIRTFSVAMAIAYGPGDAMWIESILSAKTVAHLALEGVFIAALD